MRALPPVPADVARLELQFSVDTATASLGFWLLLPGLTLATPVDVELVVSQALASALPNFTRLMAAAGEISTCRLVSGGPAPLHYFTGVAPNHGVGGGCLALNCATPIRFMTGERGRRGWADYYVPAFPDGFTDDHVALNETAIANAGLSAQNWLHDVNAITTANLPVCVLGTLHRQQNGAPLPVAVFAPFVSAGPGATLATLRRRMHQGRYRSPLT